MEQIIREYNVEFVFTGKLQKVLFHSQDNDYLVAVFRTNEAESFTICGYLPEPSLENQYKLKGCFGIHKKYGEQFRFQSFEILIPKTEDGLALFLASGIIKGIGHFLRTPKGYKVTAPEGFVAVDNKAGAVKLVDRLEFSRANFTMPKGWN